MIWVVGARGMLGTELCEVLSERGLEFTVSDREVDFLDPGAISSFASGKAIGAVINCAAYTAVDKAEDEEALALRLNADGPENLARLCAALGARLVHISTDYVFSGEAERPYRESDVVGPTGAYGRTKAEGERRVLVTAPDAVVVRTAWLYGRHGPNFVRTMLRLMAERTEIGVVADQRGSPTWARDLARALAGAATDPRGVPPGIYHYTDEGETSWHGFALEIQRLGLELGLLARPCAVRPLATSEYPTKARRPAYSVLCKDKARAAGLVVPPWQESLRAHLSGDLLTTK